VAKEEINDRTGTCRQVQGHRGFAFPQPGRAGGLGDRELPALIDIHRNSALLKMLGIDIDTVESGDVVTSHS
jgi:hypothetical protein